MICHNTFCFLVSSASILVSFRAHMNNYVTLHHMPALMLAISYKFLKTRDDRSFTTTTAKHSLELDPNVVIDNIYLGVRM